MTNPWLAIPLQDYEGHMGAKHVGQLEVLSDLFRQVISELRPKSVAILGVAGGNGLEHVKPDVTNRVCAIDINPQYLQAVADRFKSLPGLELYCADLSRETVPCIEPVDLVHAALIFEHTGLAPCLKHAVSLVRPEGVLSVILQLPSTHSEANISATGYASIASLQEQFRLIPPDEIQRQLREHAFHLQTERRIPLHDAKAFWMGIFRK